MASLKAFLPFLGRILRTSPNALYSRQRAMVDFGVVKAVKGRGPGSGVLLSGESVAALLISMMAADSLQDADERVRYACEAIPHDSNGKCQITGAENFRSAVAALLESKSLLDHVSLIKIGRDEYCGIMPAGPDGKYHGSYFLIKTKPERPPISITAEMSATTLAEIADVLHDATAQFEMKDVLE